MFHTVRWISSRNVRFPAEEKNMFVTSHLFRCMRVEQDNTIGFESFREMIILPSIHFHEQFASSSRWELETDSEAEETFY